MQGETLVLDHAFQPIRRDRWQKAMTAWSKGNVEIIATYADKIIHRGRELFMPAVVRFVKHATRKRGTVKFSRYNIYARDKGRCQYCSVSVPSDDFEYEHVIPRAQGGRTNFTNIVVACRACNSRKANRTPEQSGMWPKVHPVKPKYLPPKVDNRLIWNDAMPVFWRPYLPDRDAVASYTYWHGPLDEED